MLSSRVQPLASARRPCGTRVPSPDPGRAGPRSERPALRSGGDVVQTDAPPPAPPGTGACAGAADAVDVGLQDAAAGDYYWWPGRQVHQRRGRPRRGGRHEPRLQRRHRLVPGGAGDRPRRGRHRRVRAAGRALRDDPPDLGQTCTVFVADVAAEALADGYTPRRHLRRPAVLGDPQLPQPGDGQPAVPGPRVLPGQAGHQPVAGAHAGGRDRARGGRAAEPGGDGRHRHRHAGGRGAAATPADAAGAGRAPAAPIDLAAVPRRARRRRAGSSSAATATARTSAASKLADRSRWAASARKVVSGGKCPKYDAVSGGGRQAAQGRAQPVPRARRAAGGLLAERVPGDAAWVRRSPAGSGRPAHRPARRPPLRALPDRHLPFFHAFFAGLGADVEVLRPGADTLAEGDRRCAAAGSCAPVKLLHGLAAADVDCARSLPKFVHLPLAQRRRRAPTPARWRRARRRWSSARCARRAPPRVLRPVLLREKATTCVAAAFVRELRRAGAALARRRAAARRPAGAEADRSDAAYGRRWPPSAASRPACARIGERALRLGARARLPGGADRRRDARIHEPCSTPASTNWWRPTGPCPAGGLLPGAGRRAAGSPACTGRAPADAARHAAGQRPATCTRCSSAPTGAVPTRSSSTSSTTCWRTGRTPCSRATATAARPAT